MAGMTNLKYRTSMRGTMVQTSTLSLVEGEDVVRWAEMTKMALFPCDGRRRDGWDGAEEVVGVWCTI